MEYTRALGAVIGLALFAAPAAPAAPAELVMVEEAGCAWCARWNAEIGGIYDKTQEGARAPLRRVDIRDLPDDLTFSTPPLYTPTFVLFDGAREIGRIEGHPGSDFFWPLLNRLLDRLPNGEDG